MSQTSTPCPYWSSYLFLPVIILFSLIAGCLSIPFLLFMPATASAKVACFWCRSILWFAKILAGLKSDIQGLDYLTSENGIIAARHQSAWETFQLFILLPSPVFVLKKSLLNIPIIGWFFKRLGMISIDRSQGVSAIRDIQRKGSKAASAGSWIIIFPEGTRRKPNDPLRLNPGILGLYSHLQIPIVPAVLNSGQYWQGFKIFPGTVTLRFCPPIPAGQSRQQVYQDLKNSLTNISTSNEP